MCTKNRTIICVPFVYRLCTKESKKPPKIQNDKFLQKCLNAVSIEKINDVKRLQKRINAFKSRLPHHLKGL